MLCWSCYPLPCSLSQELGQGMPSGYALRALHPCPPCNMRLFHGLMVTGGHWFTQNLCNTTGVADRDPWICSKISSISVHVLADRRVPEVGRIMVRQSVIMTVTNWFQIQLPIVNTSQKCRSFWDPKVTVVIREGILSSAARSSMGTTRH